MAWNSSKNHSITFNLINMVVKPSTMDGDGSKSRSGKLDLNNSYQCDMNAVINRQIKRQQRFLVVKVSENHVFLVGFGLNSHLGLASLPFALGKHWQTPSEVPAPAGIPHQPSPCPSVQQAKDHHPRPGRFDVCFWIWNIIEEMFLEVI